jgi:septal ring factor EnvC (AmiA/AmiB activator)
VSDERKDMLGDPWYDLAVQLGLIVGGGLLGAAVYYSQATMRRIISYFRDTEERLSGRLDEIDREIADRERQIEEYTAENGGYGGPINRLRAEIAGLMSERLEVRDKLSKFERAREDAERAPTSNDERSDRRPLDLKGAPGAHGVYR